MAQPLKHRQSDPVATSDIVQVSWKTFKLLYRKFIQDNVYQILSELTGFSERYDKNILVFLSVHSVVGASMV